MNISLQHAMTALQGGNVVALPTETVYGLAADARQPAAISKVFEIKQRPLDHPLIVHVDNPAKATLWADPLPKHFYRLAEAFWPGPLTLVLPKKANVSSLVTGGQKTVAVRCPDHPLTLALLSVFEGLVAPSANRHQAISPTSAADVEAELGAEIPVLDGGPCRIGIESTILDLSQASPRLLRPGAISQNELEAVLGLPVMLKNADSPRVSGDMPVHYAPKTPAFVGTRLVLEAALEALSVKKKVGLLQYSAFSTPPSVLSVQLSQEPAAYAHEFYRALRWLDSQGCEAIWIESLPSSSEWAALSNRLERAAQAFEESSDN